MDKTYLMIAVLCLAAGGIFSFATQNTDVLWGWITAAFAYLILARK